VPNIFINPEKEKEKEKENVRANNYSSWNNSTGTTAYK